MRIVPALVMIAATALCTTMALGAANTLWSDDIPPSRFQGEGMAMTFYLTPMNVRSACSRTGGPPPAGMHLMACSFQAKNKAWVTILPDPCPLAAQEEFARIACHEKGHTLGWSGMHEL